MSAGPAGAGPINTLKLAELRVGLEGKFWPFVAALQVSLPYMRPKGSITFVSAASAGAPLVGTAAVDVPGERQHLDGLQELLDPLADLG